MNYSAAAAMSIAFVAWQAYVTNYLKQKAANLASKEDISSLTHIVESVRTRYVAEIETLKASLERTIRQQSAFEEKQRSALVAFFDDCVTLTGDKLRVNFGDFRYDDGKSLIQYQDSMIVLFTSLFTNYHRLILYVPFDSSLAEAAYKIVQSSLEVRTAFRRHFGDVKRTSLAEGDAHLRGDKEAIARAVDKTNDAVRRYYDALHPCSTALQDAFREYLVRLNAHLRAMGVGSLPVGIGAPPDSQRD